MAATYLKVPFKANAEVRSLGARFDREARQWFVPDGHDLAPFNAWLTAHTSSTSSDMTTAEPTGSVALPAKGIPLSRLLAGVGAAVAEAYKAGVWVTAEVLRVQARDGHVYLELSERDSQGRVMAKTQAAIWATTAMRIVPQFERATGATLGAGIKLLLRARPVFKAQYGFSLEVEAIDPDYTLGEYEARKREIRIRLQSEGVFEKNRLLPPPWDYLLVVVVAPEQGAGLGDFKEEAGRLEAFGVCRFLYVTSRFQGEGAAAQIVEALQTHFRDRSHERQDSADAIVLIRGGGAVNDLAWLNDYALARFICDSEIPVLTGIGHQRDSTILDEVAHQSFDTPSKVVAGIELLIARRARETQGHFKTVADEAALELQKATASVERLHQDVKTRAGSTLMVARRESDSMFTSSQLAAFRTLHEASTQVSSELGAIRTSIALKVADARSSVPSLMGQVTERALSSLRWARQSAGERTFDIFERASLDTRRSRQVVRDDWRSVAQDAVRTVQHAGSNAEALLREISGQGPGKTLSRGFAMVLAADGKTITSAADIETGAGIELTFHDGAFEARVVGATKGNMS